MTRGRPIALVTGAAGFIGSHLTEALLRDGWAVRGLVRYGSIGSLGFLEDIDAALAEGLEIRRGDLLDVENVQDSMRDVDTVFHLGARIAIPYSYAAPRDTVMVNIIGTLNVLETARRCSVRRLVHTSTSEVYGTAQTVPISEVHPLRAQSPYAASKIGADKLVQSYVLSYALPAVIVRPFNTFGPRQSSRAVIATIIQQALAGDTIRLGALTPRRDFTYVADTVAGFIRAAKVEGVVGEEFNLGTGADTSIGELAARILALMGLDLAVEERESRLRPPSSEVQCLCSDNRLALARLGWRPTVSLDEGLARTIDWWQRNSSRFGWSGDAV